MKTITFTVIFMVSILAAGHDGDHGPKVTDTGKYGGLISAVVKDEKHVKGKKSEVLYKAELVRSGDGGMRVYFYNDEMKPLDMSGFDQEAEAVLGVKVKKKWKETKFALNLKESSYVGQMPKPSGKPYHIDLKLKQNGKLLTTGFENLD